MKKLLFFLFCLLAPLCGWAQDWSDPPHPNWQDPDKEYTLTVICVPNIGTSGNNGYRCKAGTRFSVSQTPGPGAVFVNWYDPIADAYDTSSSYTFVMPPHDAVLYANYKYAPASPDQPNMPLMKYTLTLDTRPAVAGTTSPSTPAKKEEGTVVSINTSANPGFVFDHWERDDGFFFGINPSIKIEMPSHDTHLTAVYRYAPAAPENPGANVWDAEMGSVRISEFKAGGLSSLLNDIIGGSSNRSKISRLRVVGTPNSNDLSIFSSVTNCSYIDLHEASGFGDIPSSRFKDHARLQEIELPDVSKIGSSAFSGCTSLRIIDLYDETPPKVESKAFNGVDPQLIVYVPAGSVAQYKATAVWADFDIRPLRDPSCMLNVTLPADCSDGRYRNMDLRVTNTTTGHSQRYVMTAATQYSFAKLERHESYLVQLLTPSGIVLAEEGPFVIDDDTATKQLTAFTKFYNVQLKVRTAPTLEHPDGTDVTDQVTIGWRRALDGTFITSGSRALERQEGEKLDFEIELSRELQKKYRDPKFSYTPAEMRYTVVPGDNSIVFDLKPYDTYDLVGTFVDATTDRPMRGVSVTARQTLENGSIRTVVGTTDRDGHISLEVFPGTTLVKVYSQGYQEYVIDGAELPPADAAGRISLDTRKLFKSIRPYVGVQAMFTESVFDGDPYTPQPYYDLSRVTYTAVNAKSGKAITLSQPETTRIVLEDNCMAGDQVTITCHSTTGEFADVAKTVTLDPTTRSADVQFDLMAKGAVQARLLVSDNAKNVAILYKGTAPGTFVAKEYFDGNDVFFPGLDDGTYRVVIMGESDYYNSISSYPALTSMGLTAGVDFWSETVEVRQGRISRALSVKVPNFREDKFYCTDNSLTSFTVDRSNVVIENTVKLTARMDFRDKYVGKVQNVKLVFDLPRDNEFVEGSVMLGDVVTPYEYVDHTLTVDMGADYTQGVRFCLRPLARGNYGPTAYVEFDHFDPDKHSVPIHVKQPFGTALYTAADITLWAEPLIATPALVLDGNAPGNSTIEVYDGDVVLGATHALSNGYWSLETELLQPRNLSVHAIKAIATTPEGKQLTSEVKAVEYNEGAIQAKDVTMTFYNPGARGGGKTTVVGWDLEHGTTTAKSYEFYPAKDFIFQANLTNNDPNVVNECYIRVFTHAHEWIDLKAFYVENLNRWVAYGSFDFNTMPIAVRVAVVNDLSTKVSKEVVTESAPVINSSMMNYIYAQTNWADFDVEYGLTADDEKPLVTYQVEIVQDPLPPVADDEEVVEIETDDDNITVKYRTRDDGTVIIEPSGSTVGWNFHPTTAALSTTRGPRKTRIETDFVSDMKHELLVLSNLIGATTRAIDHANSVLQPLIDVAEGDTREKLQAQLDAFNACLTIPRDLSWLMSYGHYAIQDINEWRAFIDRIRPCNGPDDPQAWALQQLTEQMMNDHAARYLKAVRAANLAGYMLDHYGHNLDPASLPTQPAELAALRGAVCDYLLGVAMELYKTTKASSRNMMRRCKRDRNAFVCNYTTMEVIDDQWDFTLPYPVIDPIIDPSGYVYEAVPSNRMEGVTATVFYKDVYRNDQGDFLYNEVLWDAEDYGQQNPLLTDAQGGYAWDVPAGEWRVRFDREGYQTTYTDWLPVPPPQLDINVGMTQKTQPVLASVLAYKPSGEYPGGIDLTFDKYMAVESLNPRNFLLQGIKDEGRPEAINNFEIILRDAEDNLEGTATYARSITILMPDLDLPYDHVLLTVRKEVESYAGIHMLEDHVQTFELEDKIRDFATEELVAVAFDPTTTDAQTPTLLHIAALSPEAAAGKTVSVISGEAGVLTILDGEGTPVSTLDVELDQNGEADVTLLGAMIGETTLRLLDPTGGAQTDVTVRVVDPLYLAAVQAPEASRTTGATLYRGQSITLATATPGATIYYTTDGSCPCDENGTRRIYDGTAIIIDETVTIKAMAENVVGMVSEVAEFEYTVCNKSDVFGDVEDDGDLDLDDVDTLENMLVHPEEQTILGDVNRNGVISVEDITTLIRLMQQ